MRQHLGRVALGRWGCCSIGDLLWFPDGVEDPIVSRVTAARRLAVLLTELKQKEDRRSDDEQLANQAAIGRGEDPELK